MTKANDRLRAEILETAEDFHKGGILDDATYARITMRHRGAEPIAQRAPMSGEDVRAMRERTRMSQAVFARHLNLTPGYISQLERGTKRPTGAALALLDVVRRKGIEAIL